MTAFFSLFSKAFYIVISVLISLGSFTVGNNVCVRRDDDVRLRAALVSDVHLKDNVFRKGFFSLGVKDVTRHVKPDLFVVAGDCTDNGNDANWSAFKAVLDKDLDVPETIVTLGNHDTWADYDSDHEYEEARKLYLKYANEIMGTQYEDVWFTDIVNDYWFIIMGQESSSVAMDLGEEQFGWLRSQLDAASAGSEGKPIFVINHQPMNYTHSIGDNDNNNGFNDNEMSERLKALLNEYKNVFFISGHTHFGLNRGIIGYPEGFTTVESVGENVTSVNLPSYGYGSFGYGGYALNGQGIVMDVYPDRVEFTGRNFAFANRVSTFRVSVPLV